MSTKGFIPFLVAMMLLTGVCNTLLTKYQVRVLQYGKYRMTTDDLRRTCNV
jgi:hypothetical protein